MPNRMSHDRVHMTLTAHRLERQTIRDCAYETLGLTLGDMMAAVREGKDLKIICRPSQFARFVILRHVKYGEPNNMADLNMKLVKPKPTVDQPIDVSDRPDNSTGAP